MGVVSVIFCYKNREIRKDEDDDDDGFLSQLDSCLENIKCMVLFVCMHALYKSLPTEGILNTLSYREKPKLLLPISLSHYYITHYYSVRKEKK